MKITYQELKKETNNFDGRDFWYWFLTNEQMDNDTKVNILDWYMSEFYDNKDIANYMKDIGVIK
tara:strand:+ start:71 stop:262 length:192 start_codon:yes stop_codon:yes gene_type:complete